LRFSCATARRPAPARPACWWRRRLLIAIPADRDQIGAIGGVLAAAAIARSSRPSWFDAHSVAPNSCRRPAVGKRTGSRRRRNWMAPTSSAPTSAEGCCCCAPCARPMTMPRFMLGDILMSPASASCGC
jgi:hypothetical protein